jgi:hypothetical protein
MKFFSTLLLILPVVSAARVHVESRDHPTPTTEVQHGQTGTLIVLPPQSTETGTKQIPGMFSISHGFPLKLIVPDADHPFIAPGPDDQRGRKLLLSQGLDDTKRSTR